MNETRRPDREADEIARAREIVARHALPDFITSFDIKLDIVEDQPALYVIYSESPYEGGPKIEEALRRSDAFGLINQVILTDLLHEFDDRLPYWLSVEAASTSQ
jgi:hypothetical protein